MVRPVKSVWVRDGVWIGFVTKSIRGAEGDVLTGRSVVAWIKKDFSPEVAQRLAVVARGMRELVWGDDRVPEWGTLFPES